MMPVFLFQLMNIAIGKTIALTEAQVGMLTYIHLLVFVCLVLLFGYISPKMLITHKAVFSIFTCMRNEFASVAYVLAQISK